MTVGERALARIRDEIVADPDNAWAQAKGYQPLYVAGPGARIVIIGQAPGRKAQDTGLAWNDVSGSRLRDWLGIDETTFRDPGSFALLPMDFYYPGKAEHGDLPPRPGFADRWHTRILEQLPRVELTLLVGSYAQRHYLGGRESLTATVGRFRDYLPTVLPLVHPSPLNFRWLAKNPWYEHELIPQLRQRVSAVLSDQPPPEAALVTGPPA
jgi:uracil-DNA glycosylase